MQYNIRNIKKMWYLGTKFHQKIIGTSGKLIYRLIYLFTLSGCIETTNSDGVNLYFDKLTKTFSNSDQTKNAPFNTSWIRKKMLLGLRKRKYFLCFSKLHSLMGF